MDEYDVVVLKKDIPSKKLRKGMKGTVVMIYREPDLPIGVEVEFVDEEGETIEVVTLGEDDIE